MSRVTKETVAWFREETKRLEALPVEEKRKVLRSIGLLSADDQLTERFGGDGEVDYAAIQEHNDSVRRLHAR